MIPCPTRDELVRFVDGALSLEETDRLRITWRAVTGAAKPKLLCARSWQT